MGEHARPVCVFLIPLVRDSDRRQHVPVLWRRLLKGLMTSFGGFTGPETVSGTWTPPGGGEPVTDLSRKYTVAVEEHRVDELRSLLRRAGNSFDQRVIYLEVAGFAEELEVRPEHGYLDE